MSSSCKEEKEEAKAKNNAWRTNLLKQLNTKRPVPKKNTEPTRAERYSYSCTVAQLKNQQKATVTTTTTTPNQPIKMEHNNKRTTPPVNVFNISDAENIEETVMEDDSFWALERMCEKTASDPESTLFHYLQSNNQKENTEYEENIENKCIKDFDIEATNAMQLLLNKLKVDDELLNETPPSRLWDNTINNTCAASLQTSPVKMVGLMRPSTILETSEDDLLANESKNASSAASLSFKSAQKSIAPSEIATSCYETANELSMATSCADSNNASSNAIDVDNLFYAAIAKMKPVLQKDEAEELLNDLHETINLIDLEETVIGETSARNISKDLITLNDTQKDVDSSIIDLSSDDGDDDNDNVDSDDAQIKKENLSVSNIVNEMIRRSKSDLYTEISKDQEKEDEINLMEMSMNDSADDKENKMEGGVDKSLHFNDTMEEVEYMMRKGLEYMAAAAASSNAAAATTTSTTSTTETALKAATTPNAKTLPKQNTFLISPQKNSPFADRILTKTLTPIKVNPLSSGSNNNTTNNTKNTSKGATPKKPLPFDKTVYSGSATKRASPAKTPSSFANKYNLEMKRHPKLDFFKQPSGIPTMRQPYAHIVSPLRTYMQKTKHLPLMTTLKSKNDALNSTAYRDLEQEQPQKLEQKNIGSKIPGIPLGSGKVLPKKAYISSELKHIVDDRTTRTIPGDQKVQKMIESAMIPTVLRQHGKVKLPGNSSDAATGKTTSNIPRRNERSLADLSVMSGDVSLYTMMDAQKF